jgi:hypothetical protein
MAETRVRIPVAVLEAPRKAGAFCVSRAHGIGYGIGRAHTAALGVVRLGLLVLLAPRRELTQ